VTSDGTIALLLSARFGTSSPGDETVSSIPMASATKGEASIDIAARSYQVFDLVADLSRMGEWSPECYRVEWLDGAAGPEVGARFRGYNHIGLIKWTAEGKVTEALRGREFAFSTEDKGREMTRWRYRFAQQGSVTRVVESYQLVWEPPWIRFADLFMPRTRQLARGMKRTLEHLKNAAEAASY